MRKSIYAVGLCLALGACGDPLSGFDRLSDVPAQEGGAAVAPAASEAREGGFLSRVFDRAPDDPTNAAVDAALEAAGAEEAAVEAATDSEAPQGAQTTQQGAEQSPRRGGLFGWLGGGNRDQAGAAETGNGAGTAAEAEVIEARVAPQEDAPPRGLAGLFRRAPDAGPVPRNGPDATDVEPGTRLPLGEIARVCGLRASDRGQQVNNAAGFKLFDTNPSSTTMRVFYITGFDDGCARTFTGALAVVGDPQTHEFVRYLPSNERIGYTEADNAYEAIKASVCRAGRGAPCGDRIARLNRNTQFISVYGIFGNSFSSVPRAWAQILLHDGRVVAMSIKNG